MTAFRRLAAVALAIALACTASLNVTFSGTATAATAGSSAVTLSGKGEFAGLKVDVAQTKNLITQVVEVSWRGGKPTQPTAAFGSNYLQIMQCWGDAASGPKREQCQFGAFFADTRGGTRTSSRQVNGNPADPIETIKPPAGTTENAYVPFEAFDGEKCKGALCDLYDEYTSNEIPYGATRADGTGREYFNMQTVADAPGLGCGQPVTVNGATKGRSCWLVVVPRNDREVDGEALPGSNDRLNSSPLSATNWENRLQTKLEFEPTGRSCPIGKAERRTVGQEVASEAVLRWQPALCAGDGAVYGYSQVPDDAARRKLLTSDPGMVYVGYPLTKAENRDGVGVTYAPITVSGLSIGLVVDSQSLPRASAEDRRREGQRMAGMNLTPRLVAKLLTASYARSVAPSAPSVSANPTDMAADPEFKKYNPAWSELIPSLHDLLMPLGRSDAAHQVWSWLLSDPEAKAFLEGKPDPWGMKVNSSIKGLDFPRYDYPKNDPFCQEYPGDPVGRTPRCMLDMHPYASDMHDGARAIARGDTLIKGKWDAEATPRAWKKDVPAYSGTRVGLALVDTASAARYGIATAAIRNASGQFVKPTSSALVATTKQMKASKVAGVLAPAPKAKGKTVYPLTTVSYAATVPAALDKPAREDYATFLRYAAGKGQVSGPLPGQLPAGYAPLTAAMRKQTNAAAAAVEKGVATTTPEDAETPAGSTPAPGTVGPGGTTPGAELAVDGTTTAAGVTGAGGTVAVAFTTPGSALGLGRWVPVLALGLGLAAAVGGPALVFVGRRRGLV